mmetsp:Transcript_44906/g.87940  ORF Transcript_44906/g.87940 Transcript_44906/m.87940 type:complete len:200 (+) Transcript_44906:174-773(+)
MMALKELQCLILLLSLAYPISAFFSRSGGACSVSHQKLAARKPPSFESTSTSNNNEQQSYKHNDDPEWTFLDTARIHVQGGDGGNGCIAPPNNRHGKGGEEQREVSGGRGGRGGSVYFVCDDKLSTLVPVRQQIHFKAQKGKNGLGKNKDGTKGGDIYVKTPPGTLVRELKTQKLVGKLNEAGEIFVLAKGGCGASKLA